MNNEEIIYPVIVNTPSHAVNSIQLLVSMIVANNSMHNNVSIRFVACLDSIGTKKKYKTGQHRFLLLVLRGIFFLLLKAYV